MSDDSREVPSVFLDVRMAFIVVMLETNNSDESDV